MNTEIGILIGAWDKYKQDLLLLVTTLKAAGFYTVVGYDANAEMPTADVVNHCGLFFSGGGFLDKQAGHLFQLQTGLAILRDKGYHYTLSLCGDALIDKPDNIQELIGVLGECDAITSQWWDQNGTMLFFGKTRQLERAFSIIPAGHPQIERKFTTALKSLCMTARVCECRVNNQSEWETIGFHRKYGNYNP